MRYCISLIILILFCVATHKTAAQRLPGRDSFAGKILFKETDEGAFQLRDVFRNGAAIDAENPRLVAICLNITLGLFGMHRMYLGTDLVVPIAYTFTIGGGCILWLADLVMLIAAKDISPYFNNSNMFMWAKP